MDWSTIFRIGLFAGLLFGLIPLGWSFYNKRYPMGIALLLASALGGFMFGIIGAAVTAFLALSVIISHTYVNQQDPFATRATSLDDVSFDETQFQYFQRMMSNLGKWIRGTGHMLVRNKGGFIGFVGIVFFIVLTVFGPLFVDYEGRPQMSRRADGANSLYAAPSAEFPLGLDWQGRDILSHIIYGGRTLIITSVQAGLFSTIIAVVLGSLAALGGGRIDQALNALANLILTIPNFPLLLVLASIVNFDSNLALALLLAALTWPGLMRSIRAQVLSLRERDYVEAAIALDLGLVHIITREVFPNMISYIAINFIFAVRSAMYSLVGLVILGMVPLREPDWGIMIWNAQTRGAFYNSDAVWMALAPITAIALFQLSLILFTRSLEELFNPRLRQGL
ncbi:MAG: ABC transporter permease [Phototrophicaceae bacterium]